MHHVAGASLVQVVGPSLHHLGALRQVRRVVVAGADLVALLMGQLKFDVLMWSALFMREVETMPQKP